MKAEAFLNSLKDLSKEDQSNKAINEYQNCMQQKDYDAALEMLDIIVNKYDRNVYELEKTHIYFLNGEYQKAINECEGALQRIKELDDGMLYLSLMDIPLYDCGLSYKKLGNLQEAMNKLCFLRDFEFDIMNNSNEETDIGLNRKMCAMAMCQIGALYLENGEPDKAFEMFSASFDMAPLIENTYYVARCSFYGLGTEKNITQAKELVEKVIDCDDNSENVSLDSQEFECIRNASFLLGLIYAHSEEYSNREKACEYMQKAKEMGYATTDDEIETILKTADNNTKKTKNTEKEQSGGCYVATCIYGSYDCPEVWTLRRFRDSYLSLNPFGRLFIKVYYAISPTAVKWFGKYGWFHELFKTQLDKMVKKLQILGFNNTPYDD